VEGFSPAALDCLTAYSWPGNVRELENDVERAVALARAGDVIETHNLSEKLRNQSPSEVVYGSPTALRQARELFEERYIADVLHQKKGNVSRTAEALGISRVMLRKKIKAYRLQPRAKNRQL
jgi:transcriptional regulator with PAS, ATPase and Fis domain